MKTIKYLCLGLLLSGSLTSCYDLLTEEPKDFLTPDNSYTSKAGFESALGNVYKDIRTRSHTDNFGENNVKCLIAKGICRFVPHSSAGGF